ncbi:N-carbamoyl-L-amino-acid hydrolase [Jatrophihabitans endophyticus]|uniref:N-carbamoyl-L-amino-acid hydrolase n=1 Tax=Jatrophihabitans endophyticus TaxID=1206085 RepID=A0A1M5C890_9ACTN|nr:N-carbamoyl-L-amino-acid hydrolase [Jatrophihabitans endophyticus]
MWDDLAPIGRDAASGGYRRFAWTREDATLREWFAGEAAARGMAVVLDRAGNQWAWQGDPDVDGPGVVVGSHLDSVPDGGAYDGPLGVVSAFAALDTLAESSWRARRPLAVVNFGDEEGARFGVACAGSRVITGALAADRARGLRDAEGTAMADAAGRLATGFGRDDETLRRIGTFVELHVEQGRALVDQDAAIGVASAIRPHGRWRIELPGEANHAGTTALADRRDAVLSLAHVVLAARVAAERHGGVATVGRVTAQPNGVNAIASHVTASLDARAPKNAQVRAIVAELTDAVASQGGEVIEESWTDVTPFPAELAGRLATLLTAPVLDTGAGHDAGILAQAGVPAAMLFVRNPTGVSHSPAEHAERDDCLAGVAALADVVAELTR